MKRLSALLSLFMIIAGVNALTVEISQSGADPGTVMKGIPFTVSVTGAGSCTQATIDLSQCPVCVLNEDSTKSIENGVVSWSGVVATQVASGMQISVTVSGSGCTPQSATSQSFDVLLPPLLKMSVQPTTLNDPSGTIEIKVTLENTGGTTSRNTIARINLPSGFNLASGYPQEYNIGDLGVGGKTNLIWKIVANNPQESTINVFATSDNANSVSKGISVHITQTSSTSSTSGGGGGSESSGGGIGGGFVAPSPEKKMKNTEINKTCSRCKPKVYIYKIEKKAEVEIKLRTKVKLKVFGNGTLNITEIDPEKLKERISVKSCYLAFEVNHTGEIENATMDFSVDKEYLREHNLSINQMKVLRINNNTIQELNYTVLRENATAYEVEVFIPGFSTIVVAFNETAEQKPISQVVEAPNKTKEGLNVKEAQENKSLLGLMVLIVVIALIIYLGTPYLLRK